MTSAPSPFPPAPRRKPWYQTWWAITLAAFVGLCLIGSIGAAIGGDDPDRDDAIEEFNDAVDNMNDGAEELADAADDLGPVDFGTIDYFEPVTHNGTGAFVVALPEGATEGFITATHSGSSNFIVSAVDANKQPTGDLLVNTIGSYEGSSAYGLLGFGGDARELQVEADGDWEITISHLNDAPLLELPAEGEGDAVYQIPTGDPANWHLTHNGQSNFIVGSTAEIMGLVNEIGVYDGVVPVSGSQAIITIMADGVWTIEVAA